jgi:NADPH-dependent glutamate synthase beta subunit-like oxidoreductase/NAD(P)H-flavin reductase
MRRSGPMRYAARTRTADVRLLPLGSLYGLDAVFLERLELVTRDKLLRYRQGDHGLTPLEVSELLLECAVVLEGIVAEVFGIEAELRRAALAARSHEAVFQFKQQFVQRRARKCLQGKEELEDFAVLDAQLAQRLGQTALDEADRELATAEFGIGLLTDESANASDIQLLTRWCARALTTREGKAAVAGWVSFKLPRAMDHANLVPVHQAQDGLPRLQGSADTFRRRDGFKLTDSRMNEREVMSEIHYCVLCHDHDGDFCSKGFPRKKGEPEKGLKSGPLGGTLTGCPLDERISEMNTLKKEGRTVAALAMIMADNPMCPATGHRICNDCMKACVYQKQEPVNIPEIETRCLADVLALPWGVEIYDLLARWNPLRARQWLPKPYNGLKVLICGMGPAGFTLAHHLLMEGFAVVGIDGVKIEPLAQELLEKPIEHYSQLLEALDERVMAGFGGVAESGITVRWDKNYLKLIHLTLARRSHFQVFGGVRFGGTVRVEDAWQLGFDHLAVAVGAGLPQALPVPGSLAIGMRQANDFLMALHLTGAARANSLANLQIRLPAVVIGGGLTAVDTATEVQSFYIAQVEKTLARYEELAAAHGEQYVRRGLDGCSLAILDEFLAHGRAVRAERERAGHAGESPNFVPLLHGWGGVTIAYRRGMNDSPAYVGNHEELIKALEEGIYYAEGLDPKEARLDEHGHVEAMAFRRQTRGPDGAWVSTGGETVLPARAVLVATGARPNVAYEFEHRGHFLKESSHYQPHREVDGTLQPVTLVSHCKQPDFGAFTSYQTGGKRVSYLGDTHPVFQGSVVTAIASALRTYPRIVEHFGERLRQKGDEAAYESFRSEVQTLLQSHISAVVRLTPNVVEVVVHAPLAAARFQPGQFFRLQTFQARSSGVDDVNLQTEPVALTGSRVDRERGTVSFIVYETGASARVVASLKPGDPIALMGPTGVRARIVENETVLIVTEGYGHAHIRATGAALRAKGSRVLHVALWDCAEDVYLREDLEASSDVTLWVTATGEPLLPGRQQDHAMTGSAVEALRRYAEGKWGPPAIALQDVTYCMIVGSNCTVRRFKEASERDLAPFFPTRPLMTASSNAPIQCGLKGLCSQCLQWQIDPVTGKRTKAVFGCSWQDQPLEMIDLDNVDARLGQSRVQEHLTNLWLEHLLPRPLTTRETAVEVTSPVPFPQEVERYVVEV